MWVSYAPNFEDVLLARAFAACRAGTYVDAATGDAEAPSLTRALSERGWTGVNLRAERRHRLALVATRVRDATVAEAVSLSELCRSHALAEIQLLVLEPGALDPGFLAAASFADVRPWIVAEVLTPSGEGRALAPETDWVGRGYVLAFDSGAYRFHVARERAELIDGFRLPLCAADDVVSAELLRARAQVDSLRAALREAQARHGRETAAFGAAIEQARRRQQDLLDSTSWRVTRPLRVAAELAARWRAPVSRAGTGDADAPSAAAVPGRAAWIHRRLSGRLTGSGPSGPAVG